MSFTALGDIADIQMGYSFRSGVEPDPRGPVGVIQMKDLGEDQTVVLDALTSVSMHVAAAQQVLVGDIILRSRGDRATSAIVAEHPGRVVVAAPLLRIRVTDDEVQPEYLNWFINQPPAQAHLARHAEGSRVKMISKRALDELQVEVPPPERQAAIVRLAELDARLRALEADLGALRTKLLSEVMLSYAKGDGGR
jgi:hypothetical protein